MNRLAMISDLYPNATITNDFEPTGLVNIIQHAKEHEILFVRITSGKVEKILEQNLSSSFKGLIVATKYVEALKNHSHVVLSEEEFKTNMDYMIDHFYPRKDQKIVGVTGTNGKTSTCWFLSELGKASHKNILYIGTIGVFLSGQKLDFEVLTTTPSLLELRKITNSISEEIDFVALEVSSHSLAQGRLGAIQLEAGAWTNFSQDHLDYHKTMEDYFEAKRKIVDHLKPEAPLFFNSSEGELEKRVNDEKSQEARPFSDLGISGHQWAFKAAYNKNNFELAVSLFSHLCPGKTFDKSYNFRPPVGRFETIQKDEVLYIIDYAHTPDAVEKVLMTVKNDLNDYKVITVIGCGGDRDKSKRPVMGSLSATLSDHVIFTNDNPRTEDPTSIVQDMIAGLKDEDYVIELNREKAIEKASDMAKNFNDKAVVVIVGKGHESYQEIKGVRYDFSDRKVVMSL